MNTGTKILSVVVLNVFSCLAANAEVVELWTRGVTKTSGWYDFNKSAGDTRDNELCWAAASSNIINWWQKQYELPDKPVYPTAGNETIPQGEEIWETFKSSFSDGGGSPNKAFIWWLDGTYNSGNSSGHSELTNSNAGRYYIKPWEYTLSAEDYVSTVIGTYRTTSDFIINSLKTGSGITLSLSYGHEVTLWGIEYDNATNTISKMWLTDSDDLQAGHNSQGLFEIACHEVVRSENETYLGFNYGDYWYENDKAGSEFFIQAVHTLKQSDFLPLIPEPSAFGLLAGLAALAFAGTRRCRVVR